jgi:hypothetical protein
LNQAKQYLCHILHAGDNSDEVGDEGVDRVHGHGNLQLSQQASDPAD